jgi:hypothetical protein
MSRSLPRTLLYVALSASALALLFFPSLAGMPLKAAVLVLFSAGVGDITLRDWRAGHLQLSLRQIAKNPPRSDPLEFFATVIGAVAAVYALSD